jgi:putative PEP-CTERM system TPR-repeat lipoprotein
MKLSVPKYLLLVLALIAAPSTLWAADAGADTEESKPGASELYERALVDYNLGQTRTAYLHLKNALLEDPFLLSAHLLLGKIYLQLGEGEKAEKELLIADGLGAHQSLTIIPLARAYLLQGKAEQLIAELFPLGTLPEEDAELLALRGQAHLQLEQFYDAQRAFTQAWERDPNNISAILGRVHVLLLKGELNEADFYARRAVETAPENPRAWFLKGTLARGLGDTGTALRDFERAARVLPAYLPAQISRVGALVDLGRYPQALTAVDEIQALYPRDPRVRYLRALVRARMQDPDGAREELKGAETLISQLPKELIDGHAPTLLLAGMVSYSLKRWAQASSYLSLYLQQYPDSVGPRTLLAQLSLDKGQVEEAIKLLEPAMGLAPGDQKVLSLLAEAYMRDGQHIKASQLLQEAIEAGDDNVVLRTQRAVNEFGLGRKAQAIESLGAVFEANPQLENAGATLVVMGLKDDQPERAVEAARALLEEAPDNLTFLNLYGVAHLAHGDLEAARWAFTLALALDWRFVPAQLNLAELALRENDPVGAQERLEVVLSRNPDQVPGMLLLARAFEASGRREEARSWAERAVGADPSAVSVAVYLTNLLLEMQESAEALKVAESMEVRARNPDDVDLLAALSRAYIANGQRATAQVILQRGSSLAGYDAPSLLEIAGLQRQAGDLQGATWSLEKAEEGQPRFLPARLKLGELYTELGKLDLATEVAAKLRADFPGEAYGDHLLGTIAQRRGDLAAALASYRTALALQPSPVLAVRVYENTRDVHGLDQAVAFLTDWLQAHPDDMVSRKALAEGLYGAGRVDEARRLYEEALARSPDNPTLLNNLALIYASEGKPEALEMARRAHAAIPGAPELADTLGWVLVLDGQVSEGLKYLRDAQSRAADDPGNRYHIAYALEKLDRYDDALREVDAALELDRPFPERAKAQDLRRSLQARGAGASAAQALTGD